jgi:flavoprotein
MTPEEKELIMNEFKKHVITDKKCNYCKEIFPLNSDNFYKMGKYWCARCKSCYNKTRSARYRKVQKRKNAELKFDTLDEKIQLRLQQHYKVFKSVPKMYEYFKDEYKHIKLHHLYNFRRAGNFTIN